ncbi:MAG: hypothetical protein RBS73_03960 [Prolixibacteraceae bacterium]|jgi:hypothetical protein|nr:hypothetical protein [Prolixibacteraceae bacterium]
MDNNRVWELCVQKVNNSLSLSDNEEFENIKDSEEVKKYLPLAEKIYRQSANSFLYKKIDKEKNWKNISRQIWFLTSTF